MGGCLSSSLDDSPTASSSRGMADQGLTMDEVVNRLRCGGVLSIIAVQFTRSDFEGNSSVLSVQRQRRRWRFDAMWQRYSELSRTRVQYSHEWLTTDCSCLDNLEIHDSLPRIVKIRSICL
ncbi:unnamed protein product [Calypogeia fissa]